MLIKAVPRILSSNCRHMTGFSNEVSPSNESISTMNAVSSSMFGKRLTAVAYKEELYEIIVVLTSSGHPKKACPPALKLLMQVSILLKSEGKPMSWVWSLRPSTLARIDDI